MKDNNYNHLLSTKLKELRKIHSFKQEDVAVDLGITRQAYSHHETRRHSPSPEVLFKLAGIYNISVDDLLQLTIELDRNIYYDAPAPTPSSESLAEFLEHFNNPTNQKKYQHCSTLEKEVLFLF